MAFSRQIMKSQADNLASAFWFFLLITALVPAAKFGLIVLLIAFDVLTRK